MKFIYDKLLNVVAKQRRTTLKQFSKNEKKVVDSKKNAYDNI